MSSWNNEMLVIAMVGDDPQKKLVANTLGARCDDNVPYWADKIYTDDIWNKLENDQGDVVGWWIVSPCRDSFLQTISDFNAEPPTYPTIPGVDEAAIDFARSFMTVSYVPVGQGYTHAMDAIDNLGLTDAG